MWVTVNLSRARPSKTLVQCFQKYTDINGPCQNEWGMVRRVIQQLDMLNSGPKFLSMCPYDDQFQSIHLIVQCGPDNAQYKQVRKTIQKAKPKKGIT